jgi:tetratricopeptide (TPR) repeat protein
VAFGRSRHLYLQFRFCRRHPEFGSEGEARCGPAFLLQSRRTNCHLLEGGVYSVVAKTIGGKRYSNMRILSAPAEDHAMEEDVTELQFDDAKDVPYLSLGSSQDAVEGQRVLVIGNPEGLTGTVSDGIISAFRKNGAMIQITAPVSPGSSGSPVLDPESGNVIGIATAIRKEGQNLNFAISADAIKTEIAKGLPSNQEPSHQELVKEALRRARQKLRDKDYRGARMFYNMGLWMQPDDAIAYAGRGVSNLGLKDYEAAISDFTKAIQLKANYAFAYFGRSCLYYELKRDAEALKDLTEAIHLEPNDSVFYKARARVYDALGDHARAAADRKKAKESMARTGSDMLPPLGGHFDWSSVEEKPPASAGTPAE